MSLDKELLKKAWPEGYLAMRGVSTVGGWTCVAGPGDVNGRKQYAFWLAPDLVSLYGVSSGENADCPVGYGAASPLDVSPVVKAMDVGDLLPNVDPSDVATWACLLYDLAQAGGLPVETRHIQFVKTAGVRAIKAWVVKTTTYGVPKSSHGMAFGLEGVLDPAEALVRARIQLREGGD